MLTPRQEELFSHAARLALRGAIAARDGDKPSSLKPLLEGWRELETIAHFAPARRVAYNLLNAIERRRAVVLGRSASNDDYRQFGQECVLVFKIGRGDDPKRYPLEFGDYYG